MHARCNDGRHIAAQEGIGRFFFAQRRRHAGQTGSTQASNPGHPLLQCLIIRLDRQRKTQVHFGIFVRAKNLRLVRQCGQLVQGGRHLFRRSFKQPPTTGAEQGVAAKQCSRRDIGKMPQRMTGHGQNINRLTQNLDALTATQGVGTACDRLAGGCENHWLPAVNQCCNTTLMVSVVMGNQYAFQRQAFCFESGQNGCCVTRIDHSSTLAVGQQPDVVILECGNERNREHTGTIESARPDVKCRA